MSDEEPDYTVIENTLHECCMCPWVGNYLDLNDIFCPDCGSDVDEIERQE